MWKSLRRLDDMTKPKSDHARNPGQMASVANHTVFSYEAIQASEQSRLHLGNVYNYTNINYCNALSQLFPICSKLIVVPPDIGLPSDKHNIPASSLTRLTDAPRSSPSPRLIANYQEVHRSLPTVHVPEFRVRPAKFFTQGRAFLMLSRSHVREYKAEKAVPGVLRLVVILEGKYFCYALPISTYDGQGVAKQGVKKSEHAIAHDGSSVGFAYGPGEVDMLPRSIRIDLDRPNDRFSRLDPRSRINFSTLR